MVVSDLGTFRCGPPPDGFLVLPFPILQLFQFGAKNQKLNGDPGRVWFLSFPEHTLVDGGAHDAGIGGLHVGEQPVKQNFKELFRK